MADAPARAPVFPEAEAAGVLRALAESEAGVARVAADISQSEAVLALANVVRADYSAIAMLVDSTATAIGQPARENALAAQLRAEGDSVAGALRTLSGGFNNTFVEEQVKAHQRALAILDTALVPSARSPQLKTLFQALRPTMAAHLQRSLQILNERKAAAAERGEPWVSGFSTPTAPPAVPTEPAPAPEPDAPPPSPPDSAPDTIAVSRR